MPSAAPPPAVDQPGPPRTELEELQIKANQVTDDVNITKYNFHFFFISSFSTVGTPGANCLDRKSFRPEFICCRIPYYEIRFLIFCFFFVRLLFHFRK